jgi:outer membrane protein OmpA-like peptidoglycan-associated protein
MKTIFKTLLGLGALLAATAINHPAHAQDNNFSIHPSFRTEGGLALPLSHPQLDYFGAGWSGMVEVDANLTPWLATGPLFQAVDLSAASSYGVGGAYGVGWAARLQLPHNTTNEALVVSPWLDGNVELVNTGGLERPGASVGIGVATPMDANRQWWLGPFLRYTQVADGTSVGGNPNFNTSDARIGILGLSLEFDPVAYKQVPPVVATVRLEAPEVATTPKVEPPAATTPPSFTTHTEVKELGYIWFDFDSAVMHADDLDHMDELAAALIAHGQPIAAGSEGMTVLAVEVDGHASNENHPWAEQHNQKLSEQRAQAVADYLVSKGYPKDRLTVKGFGTSQPLVPNDTEVNREKNRRVEFKLSVSITQGSNQ